MTKKNKRVGLGMKPRVSTQPQEFIKPSDNDYEVGVDMASTDTGHEVVVKVPVSEQLEPVETGGEIAQDAVQNLDSGTVAAKIDPESIVIGLPEPLTPESTLGDVIVSAPSSLEDLMKKSQEPQFGETGLGQNAETGCISNEEMARRQREAPGGEDKKCQRCGMGKDTDGDGDCPVCAHLSDEEIEKRKRENAAMLSKKLRDELAETGATPGAIESAVKVSVLDRAGLNSIARIGENPDGTFGLVVTIPEGMIEPIREQAASDKVTAEEWVSTRLNEYLESWWSAPKGR